MEYNFEFNPTETTSEIILAIIFLFIVFVAVPIILAISEYRLTKKNKRFGLYLMLGVFLSTILLGLYSLMVGFLLLIVYFVTLGRGKSKQQIDSNDIYYCE